MPPLVVIDDDPTGCQALYNACAVTDWNEAVLTAVKRVGPRSVHLITNSRSVGPRRARELVKSAIRAARRVFPDSLVVLRGDSTLRGHLLEEYEAAREVLFPRRQAVLLLAPALPQAGRVTVEGVHLIERDGIRVPLHQTEYARDPHFGYRDSHLLQWSEDRSGGHFKRANGRTITLTELRTHGERAMERVLRELGQASKPTVCAPDAESLDDLTIIARGLMGAQRQGARVIVRCSPAFAAVLAGNLATSLVPVPVPRRGVLVVCGSWVENSSAQLRRLSSDLAVPVIPLDVKSIVTDDADALISRVADEALASLRERGVAIVATSRQPESLSLRRSARVAAGLASVVRRCSSRSADVIVAKGGITSLTVVRDGLAAKVANVEGPVAAGVSLWRIDEAPAGPAWCLVVPGNVGGDGLLSEVVAPMLAAAPAGRL